MIIQLFGPISEPTSLMRTIFRLGLGITLLFTGTSHLTFLRGEFLGQVTDRHAGLEAAGNIQKLLHTT